jgi:hypothetical protein
VRAISASMRRGGAVNRYRMGISVARAVGLKGKGLHATTCGS